MDFSKEAGLLGTASPILHWLLNILVVEPTALTLYPYGNYRFGLGLSVLSWAFECILCIVLASAARQTNRKRCGAGIVTACTPLAMPSRLMSPWTSSLLLVVHI
jgi:hypothetical protein